MKNLAQDGKEKLSIGKEGLLGLLFSSYETYIQPLATRVGADAYIQRLSLFSHKVRVDPLGAARADPTSAGFFGFITLLTLFLVSSVLGALTSSNKPKEVAVNVLFFFHQD